MTRAGLRLAGDELAWWNLAMPQVRLHRLPVGTTHLNESWAYKNQTLSPGSRVPRLSF